MRLAIVLSVLVSTTAAASPLLEVGARQLELAPTRDLKAVSPGDAEIVDTSGLPYYRLAGFAQLAAGSEQQLAVGAAGAVSGINCRVVDASAQAYLRASREDMLGGVADATVCPMNFIVSFLGEGHAAKSIAPALADRGDRWRRRYDELGYRLSGGIGEFFDQAAEAAPRHSLLIFGVGGRVTTQTDGEDRIVMKQIEIYGTAYRYRRLTRTSSIRIDAVAASGRATKTDVGDQGSVVYELDAVDLELAFPALVVTARGGWAKTGGRVMASGSTSAWQETYDATGLPTVSGIVGEVGAGVRGRGIEVFGRIGRTVYPTIEGNLAREVRASGSFAITRGAIPIRAVLSPFVARTQTWIRAAGDRMEWSGGASLDVGRDLVKYVRVDAILEAGVAPYARLDGDRAPTNQFGGQGLLVLTAAAGI